jgi:hypothetical protein
MVASTAAALAAAAAAISAITASAFEFRISADIFRCLGSDGGGGGQRGYLMGVEQ